jgi:hypothetical protein
MTLASLSNTELFVRYLAQSPELPAEVREAATRAFSGEPVIAYALADLDRKLQLSET